MIYRAALTYHPHIGTFRGQRGAWRVSACWADMQTHPISVAPARSGLIVSVTKKLHRHTFTNPTALLRRGVLVTPSSTTKE